jgi:hypothetical protein
MELLKDLSYNFSYWIFAWFLLYEIGWISYNPIIFLIIAALENLFVLFEMIYFNNKWKYILLFIFVNFCTKIVPIIILYNKKYLLNFINDLSRFCICKDVYFGIGLFIVYNGWLYLNGKNFYVTLKEKMEKIREKKPFTPLIKYIYSS